MQCSMVWALQRTEKEKPAAGKTDYWRDFWRRRWDSNPRAIARKLISSNFETVPLRRHIEAVHGSYYALNPLKNQDFLSI